MSTQFFQKLAQAAWLKKYGTWSFMGAVILFSAFLFVFRLGEGKKGKTQRDYLVSKQIFERFLAGEPLAEEAFETVEGILQRHPELHPTYDNLLAIAYFLKNDTEKGKKYSDSSLKRVSKELIPEYADFAKTTLLIASGEYAQAYADAEALEHTLLKNSKWPALRTVNLLRLAFLAKKLHYPELERKFWDATRQSNAYQSISPSFSKGRVSLETYLSQIL